MKKIAKPIKAVKAETKSSQASANAANPRYTRKMAMKMATVKKK